MKQEWLSLIKPLDDTKKELFLNLLEWMLLEYPNLEATTKWGMPTFANEETFIVSFSTSKKHILISAEEYAIEIFEDRIKKLGYTRTKMHIQIRWDQEIDYNFIKNIIDFKIEDKKEHKNYWKKRD